MSSSQSTQPWAAQQSENSMAVLPIEDNDSRRMNPDQISYSNMAMSGESNTHIGAHNQHTHNGDTVNGQKITFNYFSYGSPPPRPSPRPLHMSPRLDVPNGINASFRADSPHSRLPSQEWLRRESPFENLPFIQGTGTNREVELRQQHAQMMEDGFDAIVQERSQDALDHFLEARDTLQRILGENLGLQLRLHNGLVKAEIQLTYWKTSYDEKAYHFNQAFEYNEVALKIARRMENRRGYFKARLVKVGMMKRLLELQLKGGDLTANAEASLRELAENENSSVMAEALSLELGPDREWALNKAVEWRDKLAALQFPR